MPTDPAKQPQKQEPKQGQKQRQPPIVMDPQRAQRLYVGNDIKDHSPGHNFDRDMQEKERMDRRYEEAWQDLVGFDLHVALAGIDRPRRGAAVAGAVVDDAGTARGIAKLLREVAPHLDAAQPLVQEDERGPVQPVALRRL